MNRFLLTRRTFLAGAGAVAASSTLGSCFSEEEPRRRHDTDGDDDEDEPTSPRPRETRTLHFHLRDAHPEVDFELQIGHRRYALQAHSDETRTAWRDKNAALTLLADAQLTHFVEEIDVPSDAPQSFLVVGKHPSRPIPGLALAGIHLPRAVVRQAATTLNQASFRLFKTGFASRGHALDGLDPADLSDFVDTYSAARFAVFHHPDLMALDATTATVVLNHIDNTAAFENLANTIGLLGAAQNPDSPDAGWAVGNWSVDENGDRIQKRGLVTNPDGSVATNADGTVQTKLVVDASGSPVYEWSYRYDPDVQAALGPVVRQALLLVKNDPVLNGPRYTVLNGTHNIDSTPLTMDMQQRALAAHRAIDGSTTYAFTFENNGQWRFGQRVTLMGLNNRTATVAVDNAYFRHMSVYVAFRDARDNVMKLTDCGITPSGQDTAKCRYLGVLTSADRVCGVPVSNASLSFDIELPAAASAFTLLTGTAAIEDGDRTDDFSGVDTLGLAYTLVFEFGFPALFLAAGIAGNTAEALIKKVALVIGPVVLQFATSATMNAIVGGQVGGLDWSALGYALVEIMIKKLVGGAAACFYILLAAGEAEATAEKAMPIIGLFLFAADCIVTAVDIAESIADVSLARKVLANELKLTHDVTVTIYPDENDFEFPATATSYVITAMFSNSLPRTVEVPLTLANVASLTYTFQGVPVGGDVEIAVDFLSASRWVAGHGSVRSPNLNPDGQTSLALSITIEENPVPLTEGTQYAHKMKLTSDGTTHAWEPSAAPANTSAGAVCAPSSTSSANNLCSAVGMTFNQKHGQVGYSWESASAQLATCGTTSLGAQGYTFQNVNLNGQYSNGAPDATLQQLSCGYTRPVHLLYDLFGELDGNHFALIPSDSGGYHARKIVLGTTPGTYTFVNTLSWGFISANRIAAASLHPNGYIVALNGDYDKIEVLRLPSAGSVDASARKADLVSGRGNQDGSIHGGRAIACTRSGSSFLVLEDVNLRVQAFDSAGYPVQLFQNADATPSTWFPLRAETAPVTYLDLRVERTNYVYVLGFLNGGTSVSDYFLDIYQPTGAFLVRTTGVNAARFALDAWRNVYTLNFERIVNAGRTEPSISQWIPSTP